MDRPDRQLAGRSWHPDQFVAVPIRTLAPMVWSPCARLEVALLPGQAAANYGCDLANPWAAAAEPTSRTIQTQ